MGVVRLVRKVGEKWEVVRLVRSGRLQVGEKWDVVRLVRSGRLSGW